MLSYLIDLKFLQKTDAKHASANIRTKVDGTTLEAANLSPNRFCLQHSRNFFSILQRALLDCSINNDDMNEFYTICELLIFPLKQSNVAPNHYRQSESFLSSSVILIGAILLAVILFSCSSPFSRLLTCSDSIPTPNIGHHLFHFVRFNDVSGILKD